MGKKNKKLKYNTSIRKVKRISKLIEKTDKKNKKLSEYFACFMALLKEIYPDLTLKDINELDLTIRKIIKRHGISNSK